MFYLHVYLLLLMCKCIPTIVHIVFLTFRFALLTCLKVLKNKIDFICIYISICKCIIKKKVPWHVNDTDTPEQFCYNLFCHHTCTYGNFHYILRTLPCLLIPHYNTRTVNVFHASKRYCVFILDLTLGVISLMHT